MKQLARASIAICSFAVASCGGGGGNSAPPPPAATYSIGGTVDGLFGTAVLQNNGGNNVTVTADGAFTFATELQSGAAFSVAVSSQPSGQQCQVVNGAGTVANVDVTNIQVSCTMAAPNLSVAGRQVKALRFTWGDVTGETEYRLLQDLDGTGAYSVLGILPADSTQADTEISVPGFFDASFKVQACDATSCVDSNIVGTRGALNDAIGYAKAPAPDALDALSNFNAVKLSIDGATLVASLVGDDSSATGIDGDSGDNSALDSGALLIFGPVAPTAWAQRGYLKASNAESGDLFGYAVDLSADGNTLVVSALEEASAATGVNGNAADNSLDRAGAAYIFIRDNNGNWSQQAYLKASNPDAVDQFGWSVAISGDGNTAAIGAVAEDSLATGIDGDQGDGGILAGAVYVFVRDAGDNWSQQAYIKASNTAQTGRGDVFGWQVELSNDGNLMAASAIEEDSGATGINGDQADNSVTDSGAVYTFIRDNTGSWSQQAYIKASNPGDFDGFGVRLALSGDGQTLAVSANEDSRTSGINGDELDNSMPDAGAVYVFVRDGAGSWAQQAYIKASNPNADDRFGLSIAITPDGNTLAAGAFGEDSVASGINGDQFADSGIDVGAVYTFIRNGNGMWSQQHYIKAPNPSDSDKFGNSVALSADGWTLAVGAPGESSASTSGGDQSDNSAEDAGAVYIY